MKEIGNQLREAREQKKLSIHDIAVAIKINVKILQAIEDGDEDNLPAKPFLRGFVQTYAKYLDLNVNEVMKKFLETHGTTKPKPQITDSASSEAESQEEVRNKFELYKKLAYVVAAVVAIFFIYFIQQVVSKYEQESKIAREQQDAVISQIPGELDTTQENETAEGPLVTAPEEVVSTTSPTTVSTAPAAVTTVAPPATSTPATTSTPEKPVEPKVPVVEQKKPEPTTSIVAPIAQKPEEEKKAEEQKPKPTARPQQVIVEALDNVEVKYTKDSDRERTIKLRPEQILTIKATEKVTLKISDSGAVNVIHNGRDRGVPGNLGQPTTLKYP